MPGERSDAGEVRKGWGGRRGPRVRGADVELGGSARGLRSVAVDVLGRGLGGVAGPEVGAVTAEHVDPLGACFFEGLGDEVGGVAVAAAGHADVRRGGAGGFTDQQVCLVDGLALGAVDGGGVGELDVLADVVRGQGPCATAAADDESAVVVGAGHCPAVAVGHAEVAVVASGCDLVADAESLAGCGGHGSGGTGLAGGEALVADRGVECGDLLAGVRDDRSVDVGEGGEAFDLGGVDLDQPTLVQHVEDLAGGLPGAHEQRQVGVLGVGEPVHGLQLEAGLGACPAGGVVEDAAAADGRKLVAVTDERDPGPGLVGDGEQGAGDVLVEHAGLVDEQEVAGQQPRVR